MTSQTPSRPKRPRTWRNPIERYECPAAKQGKTTDELCAGAFRGRAAGGMESDEFIELANLTLGSGGGGDDDGAAAPPYDPNYTPAHEGGSAKLLGEQSI